MEIYISVANKVAVHQKDSGEKDIVCGNTDYVARFTFDAEWDAVEDKTARFIWNGVYQDVPILNGVCEIPSLYNTKRVLVGVFGGNLHTTTSAVIDCRLSILCPTPEINPDVGKSYEDILTKLARSAEESAVEAKQSAKDAAESAAQADIVRADAEAGKFDGKDGITPHIGENGNWWLDTTDTGVDAQGIDGAPGVSVVSAKITSID